jgi:hypothetical protein
VSDGRASYEARHQRERVVGHPTDGTRSVGVGKEVCHGLVYFGGALVRVHRAEVRQLVAATVLDQISLDLRQTPLILGEHTFSVGASHTSTLRRAGRIRKEEANGCRVTGAAPLVP